MYRRKLALELLEQRRLLAADVLLRDDGQLVVSGSDGDDVVSVGVRRGQVEVSMEWDDDHLTVSFDQNLVASIRFDGGDGDDWFWNRTKLPAVAYGNEGNDRLIGGEGDDELHGGPGDDSLDGRDGDDSLHGDAGNDHLRGAAGSDELFGWLGNDLLDGGPGADYLSGWTGDDALHGGTGDDVLRGHDGDDRLFGDEDNDMLDGGFGDDALWGGHGDDSLHGDRGDDELFGGSGDDYLYGWTGADRLFGDQGHDYLSGWTGDDELHGGEGDDLLKGHDDHDQLWGDAGADELYGGSGDDQLDGGADDDWLHGDQGDDVLRGDDGNDELYGWVGHDQLFGGLGDDYLSGWTGVDLLRGGPGDDVIRDIAEGATIVAVHLNIDGRHVAVSVNDATVSVHEGAELAIEGIEYRTDARISVDDVIAFEAYIRKPDGNSLGSFDYADGRFGTPASDHEPGDFQHPGLEGQWQLEKGWNRMSIALVRYAQDEVAVESRFGIHLQVEQPDFVLDVNAVDDALHRDGSDLDAEAAGAALVRMWAGQGLEIPVLSEWDGARLLVDNESTTITGTWSNQGSGSYFSYSELDIYRWDDPVNPVWSGALAGVADGRSTVTGEYLNMHGTFSRRWAPQQTDFYVFEYHVDPEHVWSESNEANNGITRLVLVGVDGFTL